MLLYPHFHRYYPTHLPYILTRLFHPQSCYFILTYVISSQLISQYQEALELAQLAMDQICSQLHTFSLLLLNHKEKRSTYKKGGGEEGATHNTPPVNSAAEL